jgi:ABC-type polysaccharide/polyol phosphate export permease
MKCWPFLKAEYKFQFQSSFALYGYIAGIFLNLLVYFFTAKAFVPNTSFANAFLDKGYFEFIIIGELCLIIPQISLGDGQEAFFRLKEAGVLGQLYFSRLGLIKSLVHVYHSLLFFRMIFILCSLIFGFLFFDLSFNFMMVFKFLVIQLFGSIIFIGFYFCNLAFSALVGRRNSTIHHIVNVLCFFSGAYFPLDVFSSPLLRNILTYSPFALHVTLTRDFVYNKASISNENIFFYFFWCFTPLAVSWLIYRYIRVHKLGKSLC